jgi:hypothetical protein
MLMEWSIAWEVWQELQRTAAVEAPAREVAGLMNWTLVMMVMASGSGSESVPGGG